MLSLFCSEVSRFRICKQRAGIAAVRSAGTGASSVVRSHLFPGCCLYPPLDPLYIDSRHPAFAEYNPFCLLIMTGVPRL